MSPRHNRHPATGLVAATAFALLAASLPSRTSAQCPDPDPAIFAARWCISDIPYYWGPGLESNTGTAIPWRAAVLAAVAEVNALGAVDLATPLWLFNAGVVGPNDPDPETGIVFQLFADDSLDCADTDESALGLTISAFGSSNGATLNRIVGAAVLFNQSSRAMGFDELTIVRHELCHALGVGHAGGTGCLMYRSLTCGQVRQLDASAVDALICLYGDNFGGGCAPNYGITVEGIDGQTVDFRVGACDCNGGGCAKVADDVAAAPQALTYELAISEAGGAYEVFATPQDVDLVGGRYSHQFGRSYQRAMVRLRVLNGATEVDHAYLNFPIDVQAPSAAPIVAPTGPSMAVNSSPNPFAGQTELSITLPASGAVSVMIYDVAGRRVASVHEGSLDGGTHRLVWGGRDDAGAPVASGVYRAIIRTADRVETRNITKVR